MRRKSSAGLLLALALCLAFTAITPPRALAVGGVAPDLTISAVSCYRSIVETDDLFCLTRYELPISTDSMASDEWCAELVNQTGCADDPVIPEEPTSLIPDTVFITLYRSSILEYQARLPRIDHALAGIYLEPNHALTWGDSAVEGCVESSDTLYTTATQACLTVNFNAAANTQAAQREQLGADLIVRLRSIEAARSLPQNSFVTNNLITTAGRTLSLEALNVMDRLIPERFQAAAQPGVTEGFATPTSDTALQASLDATATAGEIPAAFGVIGDDLGGLSAGAMATIFFLGAGVLAFIFLHGITQEWVLPSVGFLTAAMVGVFVRGPSVSVVAVTAVLLVFVGSMWFLRRIPH